MTKAIPCTNCRECPHWKETPYPTMDSFERPSYWWCTNPEVEEIISEDSETEDRRLFLKKDYKLEKIRKIRGYVEWHEERKIKIPEWCPLKDID